MSAPSRPGTQPGAAAPEATVPRPPQRGPMGRGPFGGAGIPTEKSKRFWPSARRLVGTLRPERVRVLCALGFSVTSIALSVIGPVIIGRATDLIFEGVLGSQLSAGKTLAQVVASLRAEGHAKIADMLSRMQVVPGQGIDFHALGRVLALGVAVYVVAALFGWLQGYLLIEAVQATVVRLRARVEEKIHRLPLPYFDRQPRGELLSRVTNDIDNIAQTLQQTLTQLFSSLLTVLGVLIMMFVVSPLLACVALAIVPLSVLATARIAKRAQPLFAGQWTHTGALNALIEEAFTGHELVKVFGRAQEVSQRFAAKNEELFKASFGAQFISGILMPMMMFLGNLNYVVIAVVGGLRVATGGMRLGDVQAFIQYARQFTQPLTQVASMANVMQSGVASAERVFELLDEKEQRADPETSEEILERHGRVVFDHVSFRYLPERPLIEDLSLVAEPGHTIAIVGPTGAGKTTLVNLLMRFYEIDSGRITLDGVDLRALRRDELRSRIGMVLQDTWLFGGTLRDNILYGNPAATEEQMREAARAANVDRYIHTLPLGYDTVIDEEGSNVSAGEKQLLTIARAFLANPSLLILDEATSSVDTRTELLVQRAMANLRQDRTSFVIAHRLSTIRDADLILVMESGRIVEQGTHAQLLAARGAYHRLYAAQFAGPQLELAPAALATPARRARS